MFDQTFLAPERQHAPSLRFLASVLMECAAVALITLLSVVASPHLPVRQLQSLLLVPHAPLAAAKTPPHIRDSGMRHPVSRRFDWPVRVMPLRAIAAPSPVEQAPELAFSADGLSSDSAGSPGDVLFSSGETVAVAPAPIRELKPKDPISVGGSVAEANLMNKIVPMYPPLARTAHVQGTVVFHAVIGKDGRIRGLETVSGHPLLIRAAQDAVMQWRYRPTLLNGVPVEVATEITVRFSLGQ